MSGDPSLIQGSLEIASVEDWNLERRPINGFDPADYALDPDDAALPRSFEKVRRTTGRLRTNQFDSFTE